MRTQIQLVGYLGQDPAGKEVGDSTVTNFSVAANRKVKGEDVTDWFNVAAWGKLGELCQQYLSKGRQVVVAGALEPRTYESGGETRMSLDVRANEVHFLGEKGNGKSSTPASSSTGDTSPPASGRGDEDIPF